MSKNTFQWGQLSKNDNYYHDASVLEGGQYDIFFSVDNAESLYVDFELYNFSDDLDLYLYELDPFTREYFEIKSSTEYGKEEEIIFKGLPDGDYVIQVLHYEEIDGVSGNSDFTVALDAETFYKNAVIPNDELFDYQWHLLNTGQAGGLDNNDVRAPEAWNIRRTSPDVVVAVIDGGIDLFHPDLDDNIWQNSDEIFDNGIDDDGNGYIDDVMGWNFVESNPFPLPDEHGTHVAGIIGAEGNNRIGVAGVSWDVQLMSLDVFSRGNGASDSDIIEAINYAANNGADVINMSLGLTIGQGTLSDFKSYDPGLYSAYYNALNYAVSQGCTIVIAAGNDDLNNDIFLSLPAAFSTEIDGVISVAALDNIGDLSYYTNYGTTVTIAAPGGNADGSQVGEIVSTFPGSSYEGISGTSMASPIIAGAAALIKAENPNFTPADIEYILTSSAYTYKDWEYLVEDGNYLNLEGALDLAGSLEPTPPANYIFGTKKNDKLKGTNRNDIIIGYGGVDRINGKGGDDLIDPGKYKKGKYDLVKGGSGSDTFVIKEDYWAYLKDFKVSEDKLDLSGLKGGLDFGYQKKWTYIWGDDDAEVARIKGKVDLNLADIV